LDEIAFTTDGAESPRRKRPRIMVEEEGKMVEEEGKEKEKEKEKEEAKDERAQGEMGKVTVDEFWERMSFRQECIAGAVTGFFTVVVSGVGVGGEARGQVSSQVNKRIMTSLLTGVEFSTKEQSVKATDTLESAIKGLCEDYSDIYGRVETRNAIVTVKSSVVAVRELNVRRRKR
jgi:regulator of Ty1 transposition protein 109